MPLFIVRRTGSIPKHVDNTLDFRDLLLVTKGSWRNLAANGKNCVLIFNKAYTSATLASGEFPQKPIQGSVLDGCDFPQPILD